MQEVCRAITSRFKLALTLARSLTLPVLLLQFLLCRNKTKNTVVCVCVCVYYCPEIIKRVLLLETVVASYLLSVFEAVGESSASGDSCCSETGGSDNRSFSSDTRLSSLHRTHTDTENQVKQSLYWLSLLWSFSSIFKKMIHRKKCCQQAGEERVRKKGIIIAFTTWSV